MKLIALTTFSSVLLLLACASTPPDTPKPPADPDGIGQPIGDVCVQLRKVGCPEGKPNAKTSKTCFENYTAAAKIVNASDPAQAVPIACLRVAATPVDVGKCGDANTIRVKCTQPAAEVKTAS